VIAIFVTKYVTTYLTGDDTCMLRIFFIFNTFLKLFLNLTLFNFFSSLTLLDAPIRMARRIHAAAPCMGHGRGDDVATTRATER